MLSNEQMANNRDDLILKYNERREVFVRHSFYLFAVFFLTVSFSRAPDKVALKMPFVEGLRIDTGDVVIFGPLLIFVLVIWFDKTWFNLLKLRSSIQGTFGNDESPFSPVEKYLLSEPFCFETDSIRFGRVSSCLPKWFQRLLGWVHGACKTIIGHLPISIQEGLPNSFNEFVLGIPRRAVYLLAFASVFSLLTEYFTFRTEKDGSLLYTIIGVPPFHDGFKPYWPRFETADVTWIYPPWYTIAYLVIVSFLLWRICKPPSLTVD